MADFILPDRELDVLEGIYGWDPKAASGGENVYGIDRTKQPGWEAWPWLDELKAKLGILPGIRTTVGQQAQLASEISRDRRFKISATALRKLKFWDWFSLDLMQNQALARVVYLGGYNVGRARERLFVARALNIANDQEKYWKDLPLGEPSGLPDGMAKADYDAMPAWIRMPILEVYPPNLACDVNMVRCLKAAEACGRDLFAPLGGMNENWYITWQERNPEREKLWGVHSRIFARA